VDSVAGFHHDFTIVDENGSEWLIPPGSGLDCKLYSPTKETSIVLGEGHVPSVSGSGWQLALLGTAHMSPYVPLWAALSSSHTDGNQSDDGYR
jgi:hypothetical protein